VHTLTPNLLKVNSEADNEDRKIKTLMKNDTSKEFRGKDVLNFTLQVGPSLRNFEK
jgi:hypothetical protein